MNASSPSPNVRRSSPGARSTPKTNGLRTTANEAYHLTKAADSTLTNALAVSRTISPCTAKQPG
eukprot:773990-Pleurochrysis_carterae.AAC.1